MERKGWAKKVVEIRRAELLHVLHQQDRARPDRSWLVAEHAQAETLRAAFQRVADSYAYYQRQLELAAMQYVYLYL